ncbi:nitroreductase family protein [Clostridium sp. MB40-C1]|uniref:nitroreductase family protein n=1 Tax=Clostridium sp. MB40-C1 TaxID=3070996 RepID=UPI0027DEFDED|nr:nitroreductase family protein [Clostridium sp. MB40-C1]WMJ81197.1 nitroreductase family protein [Clostridium sp. MB40-C1]
MDFYDVIENRKSIRTFKTNGLDREKVNRMINAAMMSPSWKNATSYKFILVDDDNLKQRIADTIINKTNEAGEAVLNAPMTAVVVAEPDASGAIEGKEYYLVDAAIAMEHFVLAATDEGYGTCWIASFDERKVKEILGVPDSFRVVALTPVGEVAAEKPHNPKKDVKDYVFLNKWDRAFSDMDTQLILNH